MTAPDREREAREAGEFTEAREARPDLNAILEACRAGTHRFGRLAPGQDGEWWIHAFTNDPATPMLSACIEAPRDSAWRAAIEGMKRDPKHCGRLFADGIEGWNAALAALAERMGTDDPPRDAQPARLSGDPC